MATFISFLLGGLASFLATLVAERLKRPRLVGEVLQPLDVDYSKGPLRQAKVARFLQIRITNRDLPPWLRWLGRNAALFCSGTIDFETASGEAVFSHSMPLRWSGTPEPVPMRIEIDGSKGVIFDHFRAHLEQKVDIPAGESRTLDVAAQFDGETECYGWSNEAYLPVPCWRNQGRRMNTGTFRVAVTILHLGGKMRLACELINKDCKALLRTSSHGDQ